MYSIFQRLVVQPIDITILTFSPTFNDSSNGDEYGGDDAVKK